MTRAALAGVFMGLLLGSVILAVLALQVSVVEWPDAGAVDAAQTPVLEPGIPAVAPEAPPLVTVAEPGPKASAPADLYALLEQPAPTVPLPAEIPVQPAPQPDFAVDGPRPLTDLERAGDSLEALRLRAPPPPEQARAHRSVAQAEPAWRTVGQTGDAELFRRAAPVSRAATAVPALRPARDPLGDATELQAAPRNRAFDLTRIEMVSDGAPRTAPQPLMAQSFPVMAATVPPGVAGQEMWFVPTRAGPAPMAVPQAAPQPVLAAARAAMVLWLIESPDENGLRIASVEGGALRPEGAAVPFLPPVADPQAIARMVGAPDTGPRRAALAFPALDAASAPLIGPVLAMGEIARTPLLLAPAASGAVVGAVRASGARVLPIYMRLSKDAPPAELDRIARRARRDGIVAVQLPADAETLLAVGAWLERAAPGLQAADLTDAFGG